MKMTVEWHKNVLKNYKNSIAVKQLQIDRLISDIDRDLLAVEFREYQIELAEKRGLTEFDSDRLGVKRK